MSAADLDRVMEIATNLQHAPHWPVSSYRTAIDPTHLPRRITLVAVDAGSGAVVGFLVANLLPPEAELETIAVSEAGQRRGIGGRLLTGLKQELKAAQVNALNLEVRASNGKALSFYRAAGFTQSGLRPRYYADPGEDAVLLRLDLQ
jgi:ribosomal-protein-alanine N-acetyltransferase